MQGQNPAFPIDPKSQILGAEFVGLTKREYFAAAALTGLISYTNIERKLAADFAVIAADALIDALNGGAT